MKKLILILVLTACGASDHHAPIKIEGLRQDYPAQSNNGCAVKRISYVRPCRRRGHWQHCHKFMGLPKYYLVLRRPLPFNTFWYPYPKCYSPARGHSWHR